MVESWQADGLRLIISLLVVAAWESMEAKLIRHGCTSILIHTLGASFLAQQLSGKQEQDPKRTADGHGILGAY